MPLISMSGVGIKPGSEVQVKERRTKVESQDSLNED